MAALELARAERVGMLDAIGFDLPKRKACSGGNAAL